MNDNLLLTLCSCVTIPTFETIVSDPMSDVSETKPDVSDPMADT